MEDAAINLDSIRAEVDRKGCLLSDTWTDLFSLLTKYQAHLHVKYDGIRSKLLMAEQNDPSSDESPEMQSARREMSQKESLLSKYQVDLIKTTDTLERVKHELRLSQAKLDQVTELKCRADDELHKLKSASEKRDLTLCQLKEILITKESELVHKSRLLASTAGMYDAAVSKTLQLSSENGALRDQLDRQRQLNDDLIRVSFTPDTYTTFALSLPTSPFIREVIVTWCPY